MDLTPISDGLAVASSFYPVDEATRPYLAAVDFHGFLAGKVLVYLRPTMADGPHVPGWFGELADFGSLMVRNGHGVICACEAGRNRSCLLAAAILVRLGSDPADALKLVRTKRKLRGGTLTNDTFVRWLEAA